MVKKLTNISEEEKEKGIALTTLLSTYRTLLQIERYPINHEEINKRIGNCLKDTKVFWDDLIDKYHIPLYVNKVMYINYEFNYVYVVID